MEAMTLEQAISIAKGLTGHHPNGATADQAWAVIQAHLAQPAQAVDVGAVRRVIAELEGYCEASEGSCYGTLSTDLVRGYTQQLSGAIQGLGEDGWKLVPLELTPEMAAAASAAVWPVASVEDREKARAAALIVLKTTMDLVPGATLDGLAAGIATMFPAYRAFIAAAPTRALSGEKAGPVGDGAVAWQIRAGRGRGWEVCTREGYEETLRTGRYMGLPAGTTDVEVRALYAEPPSARVTFNEIAQECHEEWDRLMDGAHPAKEGA